MTKHIFQPGKKAGPVSGDSGPVPVDLLGNHISGGLLFNAPDRRRRVCSSLIVEVPGSGSSDLDRVYARISIDVYSTRPLPDSDLYLMGGALRNAVARVSELRFAA